MTDEQLQRTDGELTQPATDEAHSIDQRATLIAAVASLAASLSPAGAALLLDVEKTTEPWIRFAFGLALGLSVTCFLVAAFFSVRTHHKTLPPRAPLTPDGSEARPGVEAMRIKRKRAHWALRFLMVGLGFVVILTWLAVVAAL